MRPKQHLLFVVHGAFVKGLILAGALQRTRRCRCYEASADNLSMVVDAVESDFLAGNDAAIIRTIDLTPTMEKYLKARDGKVTPVYRIDWRSV